ncbi:hypothetical protein HHK36_022045 [Tetracentron sinense]|uniref:Uncharacterized protein n=1 Tax=Tetracentron sinense TaxID=13715 RepID=A0A834YRE8_TETSI|nr:hypothetical protein HHK36_022045 [Tetracentron sinense]
MDPRLYKAAARFRKVNLIKEDADDIEEVDDLIKECADLIKRVKEENPNLLLGVTPMGNTVFHLAAKVGEWDLVEEGTTQSCMRLYDTVTKMLTEKAPELWCVVNEAGESPLYLAAKGGLIEIVHQVVLESSHPYPHGGPNGLTALHATVIWGHYDITILLVKKKPELIKEQDIYGRTALHYVASYYEYSCVEVAKLLLEKDSSVAYIQDKDDRSPLHFAAGKGYQDISREIIAKYPDTIDMVDKRGQNAFHVCIGKAHLWVLRYLMKDVRDDEVLNQKDNDGNTPLHLAVISGNPDLVESMLEKKGRVDTDTMKKDNFTPMDLAIRGENASKQEIQVYKHLRDAGAKIGIVEPFNEKDEKDWDLVNAQKDAEDKEIYLWQRMP